ncbi:hypothetical protein PDESU_01533 [Pontiella desulfatans]|uniref:Uncharacterized protein n=1 Tax=Pontiella desulfatans TaxID=2750659 RepID=A0A6C2TZI1_PONDE|nr:hypothetical protein [Pontiella desulfatans]VGO12979.1 hypothetical protein PDESU_01533 [Pontiella desulfatans]
MLNIAAAWVGFALGCVSGAIPGLFFHKMDWLGGYTSWPRRLIRLAHISFFGIGFLNLGMGLTSKALGIEPGIASPLMLAGAVLMPTVCYASAFKPIFRHLFFIPAGSVLAAILVFLVHVDEASCSVTNEHTSATPALHTLNDQRTSFTPMEMVIETNRNNLPSTIKKGQQP